jgi:uncharacterized protein
MSVGNVMGSALILVLLLAQTMLAHAGLKEGLEATKNKDYDSGFRQILPAATAGSALAQRYMGYYYSVGWSVKKDNRKAFEWYSLAAKNGDAESLAQMATYYFTGNEGIVPRDCNAALSLTHQSASKGILKAYQLLSRSYVEGVCVSSDIEEALNWANKAAEANDSAPLYFIGVQYWQGNRVDQDFQKAYELFRRSADQGYSPAMVSLGTMYLGDGRQRDPVSAVTWFRLAQQTGVPNSEKERLSKTIAHWSQTLTLVQRQEVDRRLKDFKPRLRWDERVELKWKIEIEEGNRWDIARP